MLYLQMSFPCSWLIRCWFFFNLLPSWGQQQMPHAVFLCRAERAVSGGWGVPQPGGQGRSRSAAAGFKLLRGHSREAAAFGAGEHLLLRAAGGDPSARKGPGSSAEPLRDGGSRQESRCCGRPAPPLASPLLPLHKLLNGASCLPAKGNCLWKLRRWVFPHYSAAVLPRKLTPLSFCPSRRWAFAEVAAHLLRCPEGDSGGGQDAPGQGPPACSVPQHRPRSPCPAPGVAPKRPTWAPSRPWVGTDRHHQNPT